jgi:hypothetical protein
MLDPSEPSSTLIDQATNTRAGCFVMHSSSSIDSRCLEIPYHPDFPLPSHNLEDVTIYISFSGLTTEYLFTHCFTSLLCQPQGTRYSTGLLGLST